MSKVKMWVAIMAVFLCGVLVGAVGGGIVVRSKAKAAFEKIRNDDGSFLTNVIVKKLSEHLELSKGQQKKLYPIVKKTSDNLQDLREQIHVQLKTLIHQSIIDTKVILTDQQKVKLDELMEKVKMKRLFLPPPPPSEQPDGSTP